MQRDRPTQSACECSNCRQGDEPDDAQEDDVTPGELQSGNISDAADKLFIEPHHYDHRSAGYTGNEVRHPHKAPADC